MKQLLPPAAALTLALLVLPAPAAAAPLPDKNLEAAVRAVLQEPKADLTDDKLQNVFVLEAAGKSIKDLTGLEKCKNLALLKLTGNQVADLKALKDLTNLQSLDLANNQVSDIAPLAGLTKLQYLELSNNQVAKLDALAGLTSLSALYLSGNKVGDLAPLANLTKLASLSLAKNQVKDLTPLAKVTRLTVLDLNDNQVADLAPLAKQAELSLLMLERNKITDLAPLVAAAKADAEGPKRFAPYLRLYLAGNPLAEAARTTQLAALKGFGVRLEGAPAVSTATTEKKEEDKGWTQLFNGKDLTGWKAYPGEAGAWKVVDGAIVGTGPACHIFSERGDYRNFHYRIEAMINEGGNSGQYFRTQFGPGFPKGYEAQINSTHADPVKTGSLYPAFNPQLPPAVRDKIIIKDKLHKPDEWFTQEVIADGNHIVIKVNGKTTVDFVDDKGTFATGHFAIQQHHQGNVIKVRKVEVKELPAAKPK